MTTIQVGLGERSYAVRIEPGLLGRAGEALSGFIRNRRLVTVTDPNVWAALGDLFSAGLSRAGIDCVPLLVPAGEDSKSWSGLADLIDRLVELRVERGEPIAAFGGGVIGDLTGFAAAIHKRGCPYVQIPTTLLAQVDSSVGGKTAINVAGGKNLVGAFHQPAAVLIDPECLDSLPPRELRAGYAELVKYGLIGDAGFFAWCEQHGRDLFRSNKARQFAIAHCIAAKAAIVASDERDTSGTRALLNFGHTFGHALEAETGSCDLLLHGEAVAIGMVLAFRFSAERGLCTRADADRVEAHLAEVGLPTAIGQTRLSGARLVERMASDKKATGGRLPFILTRGIGRAFVDDSVEVSDVAQFLDRQLEARRAPA